MTEQDLPEPVPDDGYRPWPRRLAIAFCVCASIVGWVAIAGLVVGVLGPQGEQVANDKDPVEALSDIAPAAGSAAPDGEKPTEN